MTKQGVVELYTYLTTAWPLVVKPGASEGWKSAKLNELNETFRDYRDNEVLAAFQKWTAENDKFPTTKNIINEIEWSRVKKRGKDTTERYMMPVIDKNGVESVVEHDGKIMFTWNEFLQLPRNKDNLDPIEWERRFRATRRRVLYGKPMSQV